MSHPPTEHLSDDHLPKFSRRCLLRAGGLLLANMLLPVPQLRWHPLVGLDRKRFYMAPDDHTDYMWRGNEERYRDAFLGMIDYYLKLTDETENEDSDFQSRWNCDGSFWLWTYERNRSPAEFERLIERIRDGHFSAPLTPLVILYGGAPAEAVLRSMYYAGQIERRYDLRFRLAVSMENATLPYGLVSLWAGAGAQYSWKGVCGCRTHLTIDDLGNRDHEIYWWVGPDGSRLLMKWYSLRDSRYMGGYAEANIPAEVLEIADTGGNFRARYPYQIIGLFGKGHDDLETYTDEFVTLAKKQSNDQRRVIVSNEEDFFVDFEATYGEELPSVSCAYGNEWELYCASMAEVSADVKRLVEKLRTVEALAALAVLHDPSFMAGRQEARDLAWMSIGLYWEHDWTADGPVGRDVRAAWQVQLRDNAAAYILALERDALQALGDAVPAQEGTVRFVVFNSLNWARTDMVDLPYAESGPVHVIDLATGLDTPSQKVTLNGEARLRILASDVPPIGYKVFEVLQGAGTLYQSAAQVTQDTLENEFVRVRLDGRGAILSLIDKTTNRELVRPVDGLAANDLGAGSGSLHVENSGPVSVTLRAETREPVAHTTRVTLLRGSDRVAVHNTITENFDRVLTWTFNFAFDAPDVWHEEVGAVIRARLLPDGGHYASRLARYDWLTLNHFADMSGSDGNGITLSNADCYYMKVGYSTPTTLDTRTPRLEVLAGGQVDGPDLGIPAQNGDSFFVQRFALRTHRGYSAVSAMRFALDHQNPLVAVTVTGLKPVFPEDISSFVVLSNPDVLLWAIKPAEDTGGIIARLWNLTGQETAFTLSLPHNPITGVQSVTHVETPLGPAITQEGQLAEALGAYQMRTFSLDVTRFVPTVTSPQNSV